MQKCWQNLISQHEHLRMNVCNQCLLFASGADLKIRYPLTINHGRDTRTGCWTIFSHQLDSTRFAYFKFSMNQSEWNKNALQIYLWPFTAWQLILCGRGHCAVTMAKLNKRMNATMKNILEICLLLYACICCNNVFLALIPHVERRYYIVIASSEYAYMPWLLPKPSEMHLCVLCGITLFVMGDILYRAYGWALGGLNLSRLFQFRPPANRLFFLLLQTMSFTYLERSVSSTEMATV